MVELLVKAELITEKTLAAALKIHELIHTGKLHRERAADVLKYQHDKGDNIADYINASASITSGDTLSVDQAPEQGRDRGDMAVFTLLQQAGLISENDIKTAQGVSKKHGGDIATILQSAQKLDMKTFEAAKTCCVLQKDDLMKIEQSVIIVNYCSRSRISFDEALSELNWPNPRKQAAK